MDFYHAKLEGEEYSIKDNVHSTLLSKGFKEEAI
jgi:hypothetical protein